MMRWISCHLFVITFLAISGCGGGTSGEPDPPAPAVLDPPVPTAEAMTETDQSSVKNKGARPTTTEIRELLNTALPVSQSPLNLEQREAILSAQPLFERYHQLLNNGMYHQAIAPTKRYLGLIQKAVGEQHFLYMGGLDDLAGLYFRIGEYSKAEPLSIQALALCKKLQGNEHPSCAIALHNLAKLYVHMKEYRKAEPLLVEAANLRKSVQGEEHIDYAESAYKLGELYVSMSEFAKAEPLFLKTLDIRTKAHGKEHPEYARNLFDLAYVYQHTQDFEKAKSFYLQTREVWKQLRQKESPEYATTLNNLANVYRSLGKFSDAEPLLVQACDIQKKLLGGMNLKYAGSLINLSECYELMGEYSKAELNLKNALTIFESKLGKNSDLYLRSVSALGNVYSRWGEYGEAERLHRQALEISKNVYGEDHHDLAICLNNLAALYVAMGEYAKAEAFGIQSKDLFKRTLGENHSDYTLSLTTLANLFSKAGQFEKAEKYYVQVHRIRKQLLPKEPVFYADSLGNLGLIYFQMRDFSKGEAFLNQAINEYKRMFGEKHSSVAMSLEGLAGVYMMQKDYAKAEALYLEAVEIMKSELGEDHPYYADSLNNLALLYRVQGAYTQAEPLLKQAYQRKLRFQELLFHSQSEATARDFQGAKGANIGPLLSVLRHLPDEVFNDDYSLLWQGRGLLTNLAFQSRQALTDSDPATQAVSDQLRSVSQQLAQLTLASVPAAAQTRRRQRLQELNDQKEQLERQLASVSREFSREQSIRTSTPAELLARLGSSTAVIDLRVVYMSEPDAEQPGELNLQLEYHAFVLRTSGNAAGYTVEWVQLGAAEPIDVAMTEWLSLIDRNQGAARDDKHPARRLRKLVWEPIEKHLAGVDQIVLLQDGRLSTIPWSALPGRKPETLLLEEYVISTALSGQELLRQLQDEQDTTGVPLLVGGVKYDQRGRAPSAQPAAAPLVASSRSAPLVDKQRELWSFLPGTVSETDSIAKAWPERSPPLRVSGTAASERGLRKQLPQARYIHLATHGFFADAQFRSFLQHDEKSESLFGGRSDLLTAGKATVTGRNPLILSGVVLAGANLPPVRDKLGLPTSDDGIMTGEEVVQLDLRKAELVVLSACDTGRGSLSGGGEGVFGLQRAFHLAGARHVIASLWKVDDEATSALMQIFYQKLWQDKKHPVQALREAQLALYYHPERIPEWAASRGLARIAVPLSKETNPAKPKRAPIRLWAAFTHSGPPILKSATE